MRAVNFSDRTNQQHKTHTMKIYLAARYSRRLELCGYRTELEALGHTVQARWLNGEHQLSNEGTPIGESGEALVEAGACDEAAKLRARFALDDWEDVNAAQCVISFTEAPRSSANRGGRHVEYGIGLANKARVIVVGHRENIFHWLPQVEFCETWAEALERINVVAPATEKYEHGWVTSANDEYYWSDIYGTKEEAIAAGRDEYNGEVFYVGEVSLPADPECFFGAEDWLERVSEQDDYRGEHAEDWDMSTREQRAELTEEVQAVMGRWLDRHGLRPTFWNVENSERVEVDE